MGNDDFAVGALFKAISKSSAITTDPWAVSNKTITYADHAIINSGDIVLLVEFIDIDGKAGIWIWIHQERVVWQVLSMMSFKECWEKIHM